MEDLKTFGDIQQSPLHSFSVEDPDEKPDIPTIREIINSFRDAGVTSGFRGSDNDTLELANEVYDPAMVLYQVYSGGMFNAPNSVAEAPAIESTNEVHDISDSVMDNQVFSSACSGPCGNNLNSYAQRSDMETMGERAAMSDSIICLDDDSNEQQPVVSSTTTADEINQSNEDFSIVYEKYPTIPEVQVLVNYNPPPIVQRKERRNRRVQREPQHSVASGAAARISRRLSSTETNDPDDSVSIIEEFPAPPPPSDPPAAIPYHVLRNQLQNKKLQEMSIKLEQMTKQLLDSSTKKNRKIECSVCFDGPDEIAANGRNVVSTVCGHIFCNACIKLSIQTCKQCPQCRKKLTAKQFHPIYI